jgi:hypothetical protein
MCIPRISFLLIESTAIHNNQANWLPTLIRVSSSTMNSCISFSFSFCSIFLVGLYYFWIQFQMVRWVLLINGKSLSQMSFLKVDQKNTNGAVES